MSEKEKAQQAIELLKRVEGRMPNADWFMGAPQFVGMFLVTMEEYQKMQSETKLANATRSPH